MKWVNTFNALPQSLIEKAYPSMEDIEILATELECTNCGCTDYVVVSDDDKVMICDECDSGEYTAEGAEDGGEDILTCMNCGSNNFSPENDDYEEGNKKCTSCGQTDFSDQYGLPMWSTMWSFGESIDEWWVREKGGLEIMRECGFWVYESDEIGIFFGINGAGYDFYESHWIPLYKKRGLMWHDTDEE